MLFVVTLFVPMLYVIMLCVLMLFVIMLIKTAVALSCQWCFSVYSSILQDLQLQLQDLQDYTLQLAFTGQSLVTYCRLCGHVGVTAPVCLNACSFFGVSSNISYVAPWLRCAGKAYILLFYGKADSYEKW